MVPKKAVHYVLCGQLSLFVFWGVCLLLMPHFLLERDEGGMSNYGVYLKTVVPYSLALGLCGLCILRAASLIRSNTHTQKILRRYLYLIGIGLLLVLVSTYLYKRNTLLADVHIGIAIVLLLIELVAGWWFAWVLAKNSGNAFLFILQFAGSLLILSSAVGPVHMLLAAQLGTNLAFGILMFRAMTREVPS
jgi:hypothetical protein